MFCAWQRLFLVLVFFGGFVGVATAAPQFLIPSQAYEVLPLEGNPRLEQEYYGTLTGDPHMYELVSAEPLSLTFTVDEIINEEVATLPISYIVVEALASGRVQEIARVRSDTTERTEVRDRVLNRSFSRLESYRAELPAGTYRIEVSALDNSASYRLTLGDAREQRGYFGTWQRIMAVNSFLGGSLPGLLGSLFIQIHLVVLLVGLLVWRFGYPWYKRRFPHA